MHGWQRCDSPEGIQGGGGDERRGNQGGGGRRDEDGTSGPGGGRGRIVEGAEMEGDGERERRRRRKVVAPSCRLAASEGMAGFNADPPRTIGDARAGGSFRGSGADASSSSFDVDHASDSSSCDSPAMAMRPGSSSDGSSPFSRWAFQNSSKSELSDASAVVIISASGEGGTGERWGGRGGEGGGEGEEEEKERRRNERRVEEAERTRKHEKCGNENLVVSSLSVHLGEGGTGERGEGRGGEGGGEGEEEEEEEKQKAEEG
ncbi:hypothetical protein CBR_g42116 [Chara braunii]|uniref:Uncharacterized protein n=1 Tax=Chara braunii TaxID=69332 RepID=A0A388LX47_CHABU|nr:hypothetical protein CBR_g42116 [Chara braunii]|eukprot:GBG86833.1 hypothetical protein CBR_g42116 [Chara braunii]